jgi:hypothetical protein
VELETLAVPHRRRRLHVTGQAKVLVAAAHDHEFERRCVEVERALADELAVLELIRRVAEGVLVEAVLADERRRADRLLQVVITAAPSIPVNDRPDEPSDRVPGDLAQGAAVVVSGDLGHDLAGRNVVQEEACVDRRRDPSGSAAWQTFRR